MRPVFYVNATADTTSDFIFQENVYQMVNVDETSDINAADAEILSMKISGELLPPTALYEQIYNDLKAIRNAYPYTNSIHTSSPWVAGELLLGVTW